MKHILLALGILTSTNHLLARDKASTQNLVPITVGEGADEATNQSIQQRSGRSYPGFNYEAHSYYNRELRERVRILEMAVRQLQEEIYHLKNNSDDNGRRQSYTCFLNTPFNGSFYGKGDTKLEAKAKALNDCEKKDRGYCNANQVTCEKAD